MYKLYFNLSESLVNFRTSSRDLFLVVGTTGFSYRIGKEPNLFFGLDRRGRTTIWTNYPVFFDNTGINSLPGFTLIVSFYKGKF